MQFSNELLLEMYEAMLQVRYFEEKVDELISSGQITGTTHLGIGQEAVSVGEVLPLRKEDYAVLTHRDHGATLAKGADVNRAMAELFGKETGFCKGRGGSLHIVDRSTNNLGANGIVGGGAPIAAGVALAVQMQKMDCVVLNTIGDGAMQEGTVHESMNYAAIWNLPLVIVCSNNQYGMSTPIQYATKIKDLSKRAEAYGFSGVTIDGNDVLKVYETVAGAVEKARNGGGPSLIVCDTYRWKGHSKSDPGKYRTKEEVDSWKAKDPIKRQATILLQRGIMDEAGLLTIQEKWHKVIEDATEFAKNSPYPAPETIYDYIDMDGVTQ